MNKKPSVGILGAGITGLSTAWMLKKKGFDTVVYEKEPLPGGKIRTFQQDGWLVEKGPNTMLARDQEIWNLLDELGLNEHIVKPGAEAKKRYVVRNGELQPVPMSVTGFLTSTLFSVKAKISILKEPFIAASQKEDESIARFITRRLGAEPLAYAVDPFISGVYAGDPKKLSVKHSLSTLFELEQTYGSLTKGFLKREDKTKQTERALISFNDGLQLLPETMAGGLSAAVRLNTKVSQIANTPNGWKVTLNKNGERINARHQVLISTLPVHELKQIWNNKQSKRIISDIQSIEYAPVSVLTLGFHQDQINQPLDGFGMLVPGKEPHSLLGCLFSSTLFGGRAPKNHALLTCFTGGSQNPKMASYSAQRLVEEIVPQLQSLLKIKGKPTFQHHTSWNHAIPQYTVGYQHHLDNMKRLESNNPGLFLAGNFRGGVSVPNCITHGFETAEKVNKFLEN